MPQKRRGALLRKVHCSCGFPQKKNDKKEFNVCRKRKLIREPLIWGLLSYKQPAHMKCHNFFIVLSQVMIISDSESSHQDISIEVTYRGIILTIRKNI